MNLNDMRRYGVEVEFFCKLSREELAREIYTQTGIEIHCVGYSNRDTDCWRLKPDSSLDAVRRDGTYYYPMELVTPILHGENDIDRLKKIVKVIDFYSIVDRQAGLHVHVDIGDANVDELRRFLAYTGKYERAINTILPPSRRENRWARNHFDADTALRPYYETLTELKEDKRDLLNHPRFSGTRYMKWNLDNYWRTGTVENRAHSGTTDCDKIESWVRLVQGIIHRNFKARTAMWTKKNATCSTYDIKHMLWDLYKNDSISENVRKFYFKRHKVLNNENNR